MFRLASRISCHATRGLIVGCWALSAASPAAAAAGDLAAIRSLVQRFCLDCHDRASQTAGLALDEISVAPLAEHAETWEGVLRQLTARQMPPADADRPGEAEYQRAVAALTESLDAAAAADPRPGRTDTLRRLNRTEYQNAIGDLLALDVDVAELLPADEQSQGFDNITVGDLSPTLLSRYVTAAQKISRLALGRPGRSPGGDTIRLPADRTQEQHVEGLPLGTRGGTLIDYYFPQDGEYEVQIRLTRDRNEHVEGLRDTHALDVLLDRKRVRQFTVQPPRSADHSAVDADLKTRIEVTAGAHRLGVTFVDKSSSLQETKRQPLSAHFNMHRHPRLTPAIYQVSITGPHAARGTGETPSRQRILAPLLQSASAGNEATADDEAAVAQRILSALMRRAYRRPVDQHDLVTPMRFYRQGSAEGGFEAGIELALSSVLVNPHFLFRVERDPVEIGPGTAYRVSDLELASRLSFFLWSSIPDDLLLDLAEAGRLSDPQVLEQQVERMLADPRSQSLVSNFASQWLHLRKLETTTPDLRLFPDFDDNLRQAMRQETELVFQAILREDRSVLDLLNADFTYLNERLAKHYGIPHIHGSRFRRVTLAADSKRGGLLRHGSILTVTSYATRTSPVIRGHWVLQNMLGVAPPPPPPNIPALEENTVGANLTVRERLNVHRANAACASCHDLMDPVGFALEHFDAVGRWRDVDGGRPIDASGGLPDGSQFTGVAGLEAGLLRRPEAFVSTLAEKLLTFALGRGVDHRDAPAIRRIVREAETDDYRLASLVQAITRSIPFQMRTSE